MSDRSGYSARRLIDDRAFRVNRRMQLTTDGHNAYLNAVEGQLGADVDYAMLHKLYDAPGGHHDTARRYSPAVCAGTDVRVITGDPDPRHISTSYAGRQNLTMRMSMRRFTRLTNAFSKKVENLTAAVSLHFLYYNFARPHQTLTRRSPSATVAAKRPRPWPLARPITSGR